jgi:hypothetical protein
LNSREGQVQASVQDDHDTDFSWIQGLLIVTICLSVILTLEILKRLNRCWQSRRQIMKQYEASVETGGCEMKRYSFAWWKAWSRLPLCLPRDDDNDDDDAAGANGTSVLEATHSSEISSKRQNQKAESQVASSEINQAAKATSPPLISEAQVAEAFTKLNQTRDEVVTQDCHSSPLGAENIEEFAESPLRSAQDNLVVSKEGPSTTPLSTSTPHHRPLESNVPSAKRPAPSPPIDISSKSQKAPAPPLPSALLLQNMIQERNALRNKVRELEQERRDEQRQSQMKEREMKQACQDQQEATEKLRRKEVWFRDKYTELSPQGSLEQLSQVNPPVTPPSSSSSRHDSSSHHKSPSRVNSSSRVCDDKVTDDADESVNNQIPSASRRDDVEAGADESIKLRMEQLRMEQLRMEPLRVDSGPDRLEELEGATAADLGMGYVTAHSDSHGDEDNLLTDFNKQQITSLSSSPQRGTCSVSHQGGLVTPTPSEAPHSQASVVIERVTLNPVGVPFDPDSPVNRYRRELAQGIQQDLEKRRQSQTTSRTSSP